jgi:hypothetical protein
MDDKELLQNQERVAKHRKTMSSRVGESAGFDHTPMLKIDFFDEQDNQQGLSRGIRDNTCFNCFSSVARNQIVRLTLATFIEYFEERKKFLLSAQGIKAKGGRVSLFLQSDNM